MRLGAIEIFLICAVVAIIVVPIVVGIFYCLTLQKALNRCARQNRAMSPGLVWLYLIPFFSLVWHFFIVMNMAKSLHAEFTYRGIVEEPNPGQGIGLATCILHCLFWVPFFGGLIWVGGLVCWVLYWMKISEYSNKIALPYVQPEQPASAAPAA